MALFRSSKPARFRTGNPFRVGIIGLLIVGVGVYWAFTKANPLSNPYELNAIFESANNLQQRSPVRIAGVEVGKVVSVEPLENGSGMARVKMKIDDEGLPIHKDAELKVRSRLFLEGNYFVDLHPGTPSAPELEDGGTIPFTQTRFPVQFGQVLTALQSDTREDLQTFLKEYSDALRGSGAKGFNNAIKHWEEAYRNTAMVNDATLGKERRDLSKLLRAQGKIFGALARDEEALKDLITGLNKTASGFARQEDNLRRAIPKLRDVLREGRPALASLNRSLPALRGFARDALPGARSSLPTLDAQIPFTRELRRLVRREELQGLAKELRLAVPDLARLNTRAPRTFEQNRALAACQNNVLVPFSTTPIPDPDFPYHTGESFSEESPRAFVGLAGESRIADGNTPMFRVLGGGGPVTIVQPGEAGDTYIASMPFPLEGVRPASPPRAPVFRPNEPCEIQEPPNLNAPLGQADTQVQARSDGAKTAKEKEAVERIQASLEDMLHHLRRVGRGQPSIDPLEYSIIGRKIQAGLHGLEVNERGLVIGELDGAEKRAAKKWAVEMSRGREPK